MIPKEGSAAVESPFSMPESAERNALDRCIYRLRHTLGLAEIAATGEEPERAAHYVVGTVDDLTPDLRLLRASLMRLADPS